ncbi:hypothetical protein PVAND_015749 [Polypedilum vanderplanki]|uniref:Chitin-binding type-2 domain-containing protein n=1 Tax=Polypedilum vanderplanki TaxID=319348 RepID=A0A9J6BE36_POLVA|nr:hypothetical protein PVAND_015749 [Polypedilum vanderplanki]
MKEVLVTTLILGILVSHALSAQTPPKGHFMFHDSSNRCWLCDPGFQCEPCPRGIGGIPDDWSSDCREPTVADCIANPNVRFPHPNLAKYFQCGPPGSGSAGITTECPCDMLFDLALQNCVRLDLVDTFFCKPYTNVYPVPCKEDTTTYSTTVGGGDQNPPGGNVTTSTTVGEGDVQTTPGDGGNGNGNGTTPAPCVCVIWWPCPCNPCWHFPCHSCGGCMSPGMGPGMNMMGGMGGMGGMGMLG